LALEWADDFAEDFGSALTFAEDFAELCADEGWADDFALE